MTISELDEQELAEILALIHKNGDETGDILWKHLNTLKLDAVESALVVADAIGWVMALHAAKMGYALSDAKAVKKYIRQWCKCAERATVTAAAALANNADETRKVIQ